MAAGPDTIKFFCGCGQRVSVPVALAGKTGYCPKCRAALRVPGAPAASAPPAARSATSTRTPTRPLQTQPAPEEPVSRPTEEMPIVAISFVCPGCGHRGDAAPAFAGKTVRCKCGRVVRVPGEPS